MTSTWFEDQEENNIKFKYIYLKGDLFCSVVRVFILFCFVCLMDQVGLDKIG